MPLALAPGALCEAAPSPTPALTITADRPLQFGTVLIVDGAERRIGATGEVLDTIPIPRHGNAPTAGGFTIAYDRGEPSQRPITITLSITLAQITPLNAGGATAMIDRFETDLPGVGQLLPGQPATVTIRNCTTQVCTLSFALGGQLTLHRAQGGGSMTLAAPLSVRVVDVTG